MKIIVDSGCDFTEDMKNQNGIAVERVPLSLQIEDNQFIDDEALNIDNYIDEMDRAADSPKSAAPSPQLYMDKFGGNESVFAVTISSKLSSSYQNAEIAKKTYLSEYGHKFIHVFDSLSACIGETILVMKINEFIKKNFSENEIVEKVNSFIDGMRTYFILEKYDNLVKSGRIKPYVAKVASMLSIKPICVGNNGEMAMLDKVRSTKKALIRLAEIIASEKLDFEGRTLGISHVRCMERAIFLKDEILKRVPFKDVIITPAGGICATYADTGGMVISY